MKRSDDNAQGWTTASDSRFESAARTLTCGQVTQSPLLSAQSAICAGPMIWGYRVRHGPPPTVAQPYEPLDIRR